MSDYWAKRQAVDDAYGYFTQAENTADEIGKVYQKASGYISNQADDIFQRYRTRYNLSEAEARRLINTLCDQTSIDELLKKLQSVEQTEAIMDLRKEIEASAFAARLERLRQLQNNLNLVMRQVYQQELKAQTRFYTDLANEAYYRSMFRMQQQANAAFTFNLIDENAIDRVLNTNWSGKHYSTRIWNNTQGLAQTLKRELLTSLVTGRPQRDTAQIIANKFAVGANAARRLVRTETNYVSGEINALAYKDAGVEEYQFLATLDLRTSEICREHDGKIYKVKDRVVGENFPPLHPWCRSTTVSVIDRKLLDKMTRSAIDPATGKRIKVPRTMNYVEWYKKYVEGHEKEIEAREQAQRKNSFDREQFDRYRARGIGPKTFEEFKEIKFKNAEEYAKLKLSYRDSVLQERIRNSYNLTINPEKQGRHIKDSTDYKQGRSYLTVSNEEIQRLVNTYAGHGEIQRYKSGAFQHKELVEVDHNIGVNINNVTGEQTSTNRFYIHYSKTGTHIVPTLKEISDV